MDSYNLQRFLDAQRNIYAIALREIKGGFKQGHWIWSIFPQLRGFGHSYNSDYYGIDGLNEAKAYYNHPLLRSRLVEITEELLAHRGKTASDVLSPIDARKVKSCMTLFWIASGNPLFKMVLDAFYEGRMDEKTISFLGTVYSLNQIDMRHYQNPFKVEHLDYAIVSGPSVPTLLCLSENNEKVVHLYNYFGRWFPKEDIVLRLLDIDRQCSVEGRRIPSRMDADFMKRSFDELNDVFKRLNEHQEDALEVDINTELLVEINNLCHFKESNKVRCLLKYIIPGGLHNGDHTLYYREMRLKSGNLELPNDMVLFWWTESGIPHVVCYRSLSEALRSREAFRIDFSDTDDNDCDPDELGYYYFIGRDTNLGNVVDYAGTDYVPVFRLDGDVLTCCNPPLIRHKYRLAPLTMPGDRAPEFYEKYYDLYHTGNWNAKHAIERGGFNLNG